MLHPMMMIILDSSDITFDSLQFNYYFFKFLFLRPSQFLACVCCTLCPPNCCGTVSCVFFLIICLGWVEQIYSLRSIPSTYRFLKQKKILLKKKNSIIF